MPAVTLVTEDSLGQAVGERLIADAGEGFSIVERLGQRGATHLKARFRQWCEIARHRLVLLITDLDRGECAPRLIEDWSQRDVRPERLLFRVAVREAESWVLADAEGFAEFLGVSTRSVPREPDQLQDPKRTLLQIAAQGRRRDVREDLIARPGAIASQGLGYNSRLTAFVREHWSLERAVEHSSSLERARRRMRAAARAA